MAIKTKISKPADDTDSLIKDTVEGIDAIASQQPLEPLLNEQGEPVQLAGAGSEFVKGLIKGAAKKIAPKTTQRLEKAAIVKKTKEAEIAATEAAVLDEIQSEPVAEAEAEAAPVINPAAEDISVPTLPYYIRQQVKQQVEKKVADPTYIFEQFDAVEDLEGYLTKNAGINIEKSGPISIAKTEEAALKSFSESMDIPATVLAQNGILNSSQVQRAFNIMLQMQEQNHELDQLVSDPATRTPVLELKLREGLMKESAVRKYFNGAKSEIGRSLNIFKQLKKLLAEDPSLLTSELIDREFGGQSVNIARGYNNAYNNSKANGHLAITAKYAEGAYGQKTWNALMSFYYFNMLASPKTQMVNLSGNASFAAMSIPEHYIAGLATKVSRTVARIPALVGGKKITESLLQELEGSIESSEAQARFLGMMKSIPYAFRLGARSFKTGERSTGRSQIGEETMQTKMDEYFTDKVPERNNEFDAITGDKLIPTPLKNLPGMNVFGKFLDYFGAITSVPGRGLLSGDEFFKEIARQMELFTIAERTRVAAIRNGATAAEAEEVYVDILANPGNNLKPRLDKAADYMTFQNPLDFIGKNLKGVQKLPGGRLIVPFFNVPYNLGKIIFGYTLGPNLIPLAAEEGKFILNALQKAYPETMAKWAGMKSEFQRDPTKKSLWEARVATSVAIFAASYYLLESGRLIGSAPKDPIDKAAFYDAGKEPYSIVYKKGDWEGPLFDENGLPNGDLHYRRFIGFEPFAGIIGINISAIENMARYQTQDPESGFALNFLPMAFVAATYDYVTEWPLVKGFADALDVILGPEYSKFSDDPQNIKFDRLLSGIGKNLIGGGTVGNQIGNISDPTLRVAQPDFEQDLKIFLGDVKERKVNPNFGTFDDNTIGNQFTATLDGIYANYDKETKPARADIFNKPYTKDSGRGWIGNVRNSFLPFSVFDREKPNDTYIELLRLHAVTDNMQGNKNLLTRKKKHNLMGVIGLNQIQTAFFYELVANNNKELIRYGQPFSLEKKITRLMKRGNYRKPIITEAFKDYSDGTYAGLKQFGLEDLYRISLIEKEISNYMTSATAAYLNLDKKNKGKIYPALKEYFLKTNAQQPPEFNQLLNLKN